jgi:hypothetical protein
MTQFLRAVIAGEDPPPPTPSENTTDLDFVAANGTELTAYESGFQTFGTLEIQNNRLVAAAGNNSTEADAIALIEIPSPNYKLTTRVWIVDAATNPAGRVGIAFLGSAVQDFFFYSLQINRGIVRQRGIDDSDAVFYKNSVNFLDGAWNEVVLIQRSLGQDRYQIEIWVNDELNIIQNFEVIGGTLCGLLFNSSAINQGTNFAVDTFRLEPYTEEEIRVEAEDATLTNFEVVNITPEFITSGATTSAPFATYSSAAIARLVSGQTSGTVSFDFSGTTGNYDIVVGYIAGNAGAPTARIQAGGLDDTWVFARSGDYENKEIVFPNIALTNGATVTLTGDINDTELPRFDYVRFLPGTAPSQAESTTRVEAEGNFTGDGSTFEGTDTPASGGSPNIIRLNSAVTTGSVTDTFALATGSYNVTLGYITEPEAETVTFTITINERSESYEAPPASESAASVTFVDWPINNGDTITVTMATTNGVPVSGSTAKGRFDYLDFTLPAVLGTSTYDGVFGSAIPEGDITDQSTGGTGGTGGGDDGGGAPNPPDPGVTYDYDIPMTSTYDSSIFGAQLPNVSGYEPFSVVPDPAGGGFNVWRFELRNDAETPEVFSGMRSELRFNSSNLMNLGDEYWQGFAIYLDPGTYSAPYDSGTEGCGQWHETGSVPGGPPLINIMDNGFIESIIRGDSNSNVDPSNSSYRRIDRTFTSYGNYKVGQWMNFVFHIIFDPNGGLTEIWVDNEPFFTDTGKNAHAGRDIYFKIGIYKNSWNDGKTSDTNRRVLYYSSFRQARGQNLYNAVYPGL